MNNYIVKFCLFLLLLFSNSDFALAGQDIKKSDFTYLGAFRVPKDSLGGASGPYARTLLNGETMQPIAYNPARNSLIALSYPTDRLVVELSIPPLVKSTNLTLLNTAKILQVPVDPTSGKWDYVEADGSSVVPSGTSVLPGGFMVYNNKLVGTGWVYYENGTHGVRSHFTASLNWTTSGTQFSGMLPVGKRLIHPELANGGFVGGYMTAIPSQWQSSLGGTALTGLAKIPIASRSSFGPSIWSFNPDTVGSANQIPATALVAYPEEHKTLGDYSDSPSLYYNRSGGYGGIIFPDGSDSIMIIGHHGFGVELDSKGVPVAPAPSCTGPGTSDRSEEKSNAWLKANSPAGWTCGITIMTAQNIIDGYSCCLDPTDGSIKTHSLTYKVGTGQSCYGYGTNNISQVRSSSWLKANSPNGWTCESKSLSAEDIANDSACCYDETSYRSDKGGKSFPYVYQIWKYNANDLAKVISGTNNPNTGIAYQPWDFIPEIINFDLPFAPPVKAILGATYDPLSKILYVSQFNGDGGYSLIHGYRLNVINATSFPSAPKNVSGTVIK